MHCAQVIYCFQLKVRKISASASLVKAAALPRPFQQNKKLKRENKTVLTVITKLIVFDDFEFDVGVFFIARDRFVTFEF